MTQHEPAYQVGVRDLRDRLSEHLKRVEAGIELTVTRRGKPIARLDPLQDLVARGLASPPRRARTPRRATIEANGPVSELVDEQRR